MPAIARRAAVPDATDPTSKMAGSKNLPQAVYCSQSVVPASVLAAHLELRLVAAFYAGNCTARGRPGSDGSDVQEQRSLSMRFDDDGGGAAVNARRGAAPGCVVLCSLC